MGSRSTCPVCPSRQLRVCEMSNQLHKNYDHDERSNSFLKTFVFQKKQFLARKKVLPFFLSFVCQGRGHFYKRVCTTALIRSPHRFGSSSSVHSGSLSAPSGAGARERHNYYDVSNPSGKICISTRKAVTRGRSYTGRGPRMKILARKEIFLNGGFLYSFMYPKQVIYNKSPIMVIFFL